VKCIRLGHPARMSADLQPHSLEALIATSDQTQIVRDIYAEIDGLLKGGGGGGGREHRPRMRNEIRELRKELRERERRVLKELLLKAEVILGLLQKMSFLLFFFLIPFFFISFSLFIFPSSCFSPLFLPFLSICLLCRTVPFILLPSQSFLLVPSILPFLYI
jgi:hypothetical protein